MASGRIEANWVPIADLLALTANCHRDPKKSPAVKPEEFGPPRRLFRIVKPRPLQGSVQALKIFLPNHA